VRMLAFEMTKMNLIVSREGRTPERCSAVQPQNVRPVFVAVPYESRAPPTDNLVVLRGCVADECRFPSHLSKPNPNRPK
jgi:hypothetical protein